MKKPILSAILLALAAGTMTLSAAAPARSTAAPHAGARKVLADIQKPTDFSATHILKHRAVTRASEANKTAAGMYTNTPAVLRHRVSPLAAKAPARAAITDGLTLRASVISSQDWMLDMGMYNVPTTAGGAFELLGWNVMVEYGGYDDGNGNFYVAGIVDWGMGYTVPYLDVYSTDTWELTGSVEEADFSILCTDNAVDPTSGIVYGCYQDAETGDLTWASANYAAGNSTPIKAIPDDQKMWGVACDAHGQFYAILENGDLVKVNKTTGDTETIGNTGLRPYYTTGATFDDKAGKIIFAYSPITGTGALWTIDPVTAAAEIAVEYPNCEQLTCLTVTSTGTEPKAPAAPQLTVKAVGGSLDAEYSIVMPSLNSDGSEGESSLTYTFMVDGVTEDSGTASKGETITGKVSLSTEGMHAFSAVATNSVGMGARAQTEVFVGMGVPSAPATLSTVLNADGSVSLSWDAVTTSVDGGYIAPEDLTYTITCDGESVATGLTDTKYTHTPATPNGYAKLVYAVMAVNAGKESMPAESIVGIGAINPPYACTFDTDKSDDNLYSTFNLNNDNSYWYYTPYYKCFKVDYVNDSANDDWLVSPAFHLEAGKTYEFSYRICAGSTMYGERYSLAMGTTPEPAALTTVLLPETDLTNDPETPIVETITIKPEVSGNYFIGWHAVSPAPCFMIRVDKIAMSAPLSSASPAEVTDIALTPDEDGFLSLEGKFTLPRLSITSEPLSENCKVTITRQDKTAPVAVLTGSAGTTLTFSDTDIPQAGTYTYEFVTESVSGAAGRSTKASVYVGPVAPEPVTAITVKETDVPGTVHLSWTAPEFTVEGKPLKSQNVKYMVYVRGTGNTAVEVLDEPIAECEATIKVCEPDQSTFAILYVEAQNLGLAALEMPHCEMTPVGSSATVPYSQSYTAADRAKNIVGILAPEGSYAEWSVGSFETAGIKAQDNDDAFLYLYAPMQYTQPEFYTGKVNLQGLENPALTFYHYVLSNNDTNEFEVFAVTPDGRFTSLGTVRHEDGFTDGWNLAHFSLEKVKGQIVYLVVRTTVNSHQNMAFDNLRIYDMPAVDLAATRLTAPARVEIDKAFDLAVTVANLGSTVAKDYTVELMLDGQTVASANGDEIAVGGEATVKFSHILSPLTSADPVFTAKVTIAGDADETNNVCAAATPSLNLPKWPAVNDLKASAGDNGVELSWTAPATDGFEAKEVEDFEDATPWTDEVEGWTLIDRDGQQIGMLDAVGMPEAVDMRTRHSFFVLDNQHEDIYFYNPAVQPLFAAHSGSRCMAAVYILSYSTPQDDWAISPELSGEAQTVSFYARSYHPDYPDKMEVLYSTENSVDPDDFTSLCPDGPFEVPQKVDALGTAEYTLYEYALPAGAKRFAIRTANEGGEGYMLMFDDVKMKLANATLEINSYDIYRNGVKVGTVQAGNTSFTDNEAEGNVEYHVVVNYNRGLSGASNSAHAAASGINGVAAGHAPVVSAVDHTIVVSGADADTPVAIYSTDGRTLYQGQGNVRVTLSSGLYLVKAGTTTAKVPLP